MDIVVEMKQITKKFGSVVANDSVNFDLRRGEIHCLLGENGAGKTTLMNMLYGLWEMDEGEIFIEGEKVNFKSPKDAIKSKIGMVAQHFSLIPTLSVYENIVMGDIPSKHFLLDRKKMNQIVLNLSQNLGFKTNPNSIVEDISVGEQQKVEILKVLYNNAKIIILDEPTAVLTPREIDELFIVLRRMTLEKKSIIIITHKFNEAMKCDRLTVMRSGRVILKSDTKAVSIDGISEAMFGKKVLSGKVKKETKKGNVILEVKKLCTKDYKSNCLKDVSFDAYAGEIFGIAGVAGNGQDLLLEALIGLRNDITGSIVVKGKDITKKSTKFCRELGIACIPEERKRSGLLQGMPLVDNIILGKENKKPFSQGLFLDHLNINKFALEMVEHFNIKTESVHTLVQHLSGGNAQKLILAREFAHNPNLIIASQPSRGLDAKTVEFIHEIFKEEREKGKTIILISYDLDEILKLADRIGVFYNGEMKVFCNSENNVQEIEKMMTGIRDNNNVN